MVRKSGSLGILLVLLAVILIPTGAASIWLGTNGIVINDPNGVHFGPTTTAEINNGWIIASIGLASLVIFLLLYLFGGNILSTELPHFP
ncbi:MAG: hypothetical protein NWE93_11700 [Candidatus Bathyarchaeota archaeon]|nr:hypothetical protein [Candidatus Bathyarchaeota archaeon]